MKLKQNFSLFFGVLICICCKVTEVYSAATTEQMNAAGKLIREVCFPKFPKVTVEIADGIRGGECPNEMDAKCYINCILELMQTMKKGKFLYEGSLKQVDMLLPEDLQGEYRVGLANCKNAAVGIKNHCEGSYAIYMCLKKEIEHFVFP